MKVVKGSKVYQVTLPVTPPSMENRFLIKNASSIKIYSPFCTLIISDETGENSINVADFRSVWWDKKNFYIYAIKKPLYPVKKYHFKYKFVIKPPQVSINEIQLPEVVFQTEKDVDVNKKVIIPYPQEIEFKKGHFLINGKTSIVILDEEYLSLANILKEEINSLFDLELKIQKTQIKDLKNMILLATLDFLPQDLLDDFHSEKLKPEGYYLLVNNDQIIIAGQDKRGIFYGIQTLLQLIEKDKDKITVPSVEIKDWPALRIRGMCITAPTEAKLNILKKYIKALAKYKANTVVLYYKPNHLFDYIKRKKALEDLKELSLFAKKYFIEVIPGLSAKLNTKLFENIVENKNVIQSFYCPSLSESYKVMFSLYQDLIDACHPKYFLIGHDEIKDLAKCPRCRDKEPYKLLLKDIIKIHNWLAKRGITTLMWGDMLLNRKDWPNDITAHSNAYGYPSNTHKALSFLPKDIVILDWQYKPRKNYPTFKYFKDKDFKVIGVSWYDGKNNYYLAQSAYKYGALGILGSDWGFSHTLSFGANSILCLEYAWSPGVPELEDLSYDPITTFAKQIKPPLLDYSSKKTFIPIDLSPYANESTIDEKFGDGKGWFDLGSLFDLRNLPIGEQKFAGINFYIASPENGQRNCIIFGKNTYQPLPEEIKGIKINKKVKALFFLHTMMSPLASVWHKTIGVYKINYADGTFVDVKLVENFNITDFRSSGIFRENPWTFNKGFEILYGAECGWEGISLCGEKINLQVCKWKNPFPEKIVKSIDMRAIGKKPVKIALLGISTLN
ncbi:MAG TPA: hypothetical protein ENG63_08435 [Candidatus Desulfofervidus auxilii]|uniref:beta-N-acetylhexosaminidase n=1 Tax=Desulfofervidus auxilii TaxID=1621989 RepID=A0A7C0Y679_DESA2|nr:hypothetical protein [Candidatus Desulfofervidus auxilii]